MRGNWENAAPDMGERAGIFKKHGIELDKVYTQGTGETAQVVISGASISASASGRRPRWRPLPRARRCG